MKRRLFKELRALLGPWCLAFVCAGLIPAVLPLLDRSGDGFISAALTLLFGFSIALTAALAFGAEYQYHTLALLIAQPVPRLHLWREKMIALVLAESVIVLCYWLSFALAAHFLLPVVAPLAAFWCAMFAVTTVCSAAFWTLVARSSIGGMAFNIASQCVTVLLIQLTMTLITRPGSRQPDPLALVVMAVVPYSAVFLWLGWRKFASLELSGFEAGAASPARVVPRQQSRPTWLTSRPQGAVANFCRKELRLHKPTLTLALVFCLCWLVALLWFLVQPARQELIGSVLAGITVFYIPLCLLLAGAISVTEEKHLGVAAWQLSLPLSTFRQWLLKLAIGAGVGCVLAMIVPGILALAAILLRKSNLKSPAFDDWPMLVVFPAFFVLAFWASTLTTNMVRATVLVLSAAVALVLLGVGAVWCAAQFDGLQTPLLTGLAARLAWSPQHVWDLSEFLVLSMIFVGVTLILLRQSLRQFRTTTSWSRTLRHAAVLVATTMLLSFWSADLQRSASNVQFFFRQAVVPVLRSLPPAMAPREVHLKELQAVAPVAPRLALWLKNAVIWVDKVSGDEELARITFSDASTSSFRYHRTRNAEGQSDRGPRKR